MIIRTTNKAFYDPSLKSYPFKPFSLNHSVLSKLKNQKKGTAPIMNGKAHTEVIMHIL